MTLKSPPLRNRRYLDHLRTERCLLTGVYGHSGESVVPMHIGTAGRGMKAGDNEAIPVINHLHIEGHQHGEVSMLRKHAPDDVLRAAFRALAREIYKEWEDA